MAKVPHTERGNSSETIPQPSRGSGAEAESERGSSFITIAYCAKTGNEIESANTQRQPYKRMGMMLHQNDGERAE